MKGPAIFLAQFAGTAPPFDKLDLEQAAKSQALVAVHPASTPAFSV